MPIYEYECSRCSYFEVTQSIKDGVLLKCINPECDGSVNKLISSGNFILEGSGFTQRIVKMPKKQSRSNQNNLILAEQLITLLLVFQIVDGILTYVGVSGGFSDEENPLVRSVVDLVGLGLGLFLVKSCAIMVLLKIRKYAVNFIGFLFCAALAYTFAVLSWIYIIFS